MNKPIGSPRSLEEALTQIIFMRPQEGKDVLAHSKYILRDFFAQKFGIALMRAHTPEQEAMLAELWKALTGEENFGRNQ